MAFFCSNAKRFEDVLSLSSETEISEIEKLQPSIAPDACYNIQFTSGTTGKPKAARLSHFSLVNCGYDMGKFFVAIPPLLLTCEPSLYHQAKDKS
jgi:long-subunit acyl-CoA synthetase (AMP-forming)